MDGNVRQVSAFRRVEPGRGLNGYEKSKKKSVGMVAVPINRNAFRDLARFDLQAHTR